MRPLLFPLSHALVVSMFARAVWTTWPVTRAVAEADTPSQQACLIRASSTGLMALLESMNLRRFLLMQMNQASPSMRIARAIQQSRRLPSRMTPSKHDCFTLWPPTRQMATSPFTILRRSLLMHFVRTPLLFAGCEQLCSREDCS